MNELTLAAAIGIIIIGSSLICAAEGATPKHISCPDGDHIEIDVNEISIKYSGAGFSTTLAGLSRVELADKQLQNAAEATQQWNQFIEGLVVGYNSCAITRAQYADSLNRIYPRLSEDATSLEAIRQTISKGQATDASAIAVLTNRFNADLREFARASGKEEILDKLQVISEQNNQILHTEQQINEQLGTDTETLATEIKELREELRNAHIASPAEISTAVGEVRKALLKKADAAENAYNQGYDLLKSNRSSEAIPYLEQAIDDVPLSQFYSTLGSAYLDSGDRENALLAYRNAVRLDPNDDTAHNSIGVILLIEKKDDEAIQEIELATLLKPEDATYHLNLSAVLIVSHRLEEAAAEAREAVRLQPGSSSTHRGLGQLCLLQEDFKNAIEQFRIALSTNDNDAESHLGLAWALFNSDMRAEAAAEFSRAISLQPKNSSALTGLGWGYYFGNHNSEAKEYFQKALQIDSDNALAHRGLAAALYTDDKFNESIEEDKKALSITPENWNAHHDLAENYLRLGNWQDAAAQYRIVLQERPNEELAKSHLGIALYGLNQYREADGLFEATVSNQLQDFNVQFYAAMTFLQLGYYQKAIDPIQRATSLQPNYILLPSLQCAAFFGSHDSTDAVPACRRAVAIEPNEATYHEVLGMVLDDIGEHAESTREMQKAEALKQPRH